MTGTEFQPRNQNVYTDGMFDATTAATLSRLEFLTYPILASPVRQV